MGPTSHRALAPRRASSLAAWCLVSLMGLGGCLDGSGGSGGGGGSLSGSWSQTQGACTQYLTFDETGTFEFGVSLKLASGTWHEGVEGVYAQDAGGGGQHALELEYDTVSKSSDIAYCAQWARRAEQVAPVAALSAALGANVDNFHFRYETSPALGTVLIGTAPDRTDRLALYRAGPTLRAARLDGTAHYALDLVAALPEDATLDPEPPVAATVLNFPRAIYRRTFDVSSLGRVALLILNLTAAADVTFSVESPGAGTPRCAFVAYQDLSLTAAVDPAPLNVAEATQTLRLNAADGSAPLLTFDVDTDDGTLPASLLPLAINGLSAGECTVTIRAVALSAVVLADIVQAGGFAPLMSLPLGGDAFAVGYAAGHGETARRVPWWMGLPAAGLAGLPLRWGAAPPLAHDAEGEAPGFDLLGLSGGAGASLDVSVGETGGVPYLNLYGEQGGSGMGPFLAVTPGDNLEALPFPGTLTVEFAQAGVARAFRFTVPETARVALWSAGGADTYAVLSDAAGRVIGSDDDGAEDGVGFRIVRSLRAGDHELTVTSRDDGVSVTLRAQAAGAAPVPDEELEACLIANGFETVESADWTTLSCAGQGIESLTGLAGVADFRTLAMSGNRIESVAPLAALTELREVVLADNLVTDASALAGLPRLHTLVLARNPVTAASLKAFTPLADTLRLLDLTGVPSAAGSTLTALRNRLPVTTILDREGNVVP